MYKITKMRVFLLSFLMFATLANAQLSDFNLQVTKTDETCLGNGSLTFIVSNTTPQSTMLYKVYKLPNTTTPVSVLTETTLSSLTSGNYRVVAIQALGNQTNSKQQDVTINNNRVSFNFSVAAANQNCASGGDVIVNVTSGIGASYEILSGPVTKPLQSSNIFTGLPSGTYNIRAYNNCGVAKVKTFTLTIVNTSLEISEAFYPQVADPQCDFITVNNTVTPTSGSISYPVTVQHTLNTMDLAGEYITINQVIPSGEPDALVISALMPRYATQSYTYDVRVTDNCNTVYERLDNTVNPSIEMALSTGVLSCANRKLVVAAAKHIAPYTVEFVSAPAGFTAAGFNAGGQGPFGTDTVDYGSEENPVPFGNYIVKITDACGRVAQDTLLVEFKRLKPSARGTNNGCFSLFGKIRVSVPNQKLVSATIIAAPDTYTETLEQDVTNKINNAGTLVLADMPLGIYKIKFTDDCGFEYVMEVEVPPFVEKDFDIATLPDCTPGFGTVRLRSGNGKLISVIASSSPNAFGQGRAVDVTENIDAEGDFYINNLPAGNYTFTATDVCGIVHEMPITVEGYVPPQNSFVFTPNCGTFSVKVTDTSNGTEGSSYWLQKFNPATQNWGHPGNGNIYTGGTPTAANSIKLTNNTTRNNLSYTGQFRVVKKFESFGNATAENTECISILGEFNYTDAFAIGNAYTMACMGHPNDVYIESVGYVVSYKITKKNGVRFDVDNGTSNIFTNLDSATYVFAIEDACGNKETKEFNLGELPSIADANRPSDMRICVETGAARSNVFHLTDQNEQILNGKPAAMYTITYHLTQADADNAANPLPEYYTNTTNGQIIYVRMINNHIALCPGTTSFALYVGEIQKPVITTQGTICNDGKLALIANAGYTSYRWSTGETTRTIYVTEPGNYTVTVEKAYGTEHCDGVAEITVNQSFTPTIRDIDTHDWTRSENGITINTDGNGKYEYSIDGINFQESNVFTNLETGPYTVTVRDAFGCGVATKDVVLMYYPNFFTPNGDGTHDKWHINYSMLEPHMIVNIFDRYGKKITSLTATSEGWDGTLNGAALPSTDYWFVVTREDGREFKGHFAMLR
jgi:gliding motility-associated-like protein